MSEYVQIIEGGLMVGLYLFMFTLLGIVLYILVQEARRGGISWRETVIEPIKALLISIAIALVVILLLTFIGIPLYVIGKWFVEVLLL